VAEIGIAQRFESARALVVVGGATLTGALAGALTTALPMALLYLSREFGRTCYPWQSSERVEAVLMLAVPGAVGGLFLEPWQARSSDG
jgi:hypothetical protein